MFTYANLLDETERICRYGVETGVVGESHLKQRIPYLFVGKKNGNYLIVQAAIHAREHFTALLALCLAKYLIKNPNLKLDGGIYFVPMSNPDGVRLCQEGVDFVQNYGIKQNLIAVNGGSTDFSLWKANANCVDLNVNFDAHWGEGSSNVFSPAPTNYIGPSPFSEAESRALMEFTLRIKPLATVSYHLKGEEVYWQFGQTGAAAARDEKLANAIASYTGYSVKTTPTSVGGYKDWCIERLKIPSFTIEVGSDDLPHPFPYAAFADVYRQNEDLPRRLLNSVVKLTQN